MSKQTLRLARKQDVAAMLPRLKTHDVAHFEITHHQILDTNGKLVAELPKFAEHSAKLIALYRSMVKTRVFDNKAVTLQRRGQLGTYASSLGQEAIGAAIGSAMAANDVLLPAYREYAAQFIRGVTMTEILLYWGGNERGMNFQGPRHDFPLCVPIASQTPQAVGVAYAMQLRGEKRVAVCVLGDGATSKGDFYEAMNAAGAWNLPLVFIINNNRWAISVPRHNQSQAETLAQKAVAAGIPGEQVDGNDVIALYERIQRALHKAREGNGPSVIEALSYRLCDHTTADDASRYRDDSEVKQHWRCEPLLRLRRYLQYCGCWTQDDEEKLMLESTHEVAAAVDEYLAAPQQPLESIFDYLYHSLPAALQEQRLSVAGGGDDHG